MTLSLKGPDVVARNLQKLARSHPEHVLQAIAVEAELIMTESQREVPRRTGSLASSRFVRRDGGALRYLLGYSIHYAHVVHERNLRYRVGKWQYLADPLRRAARGYSSRVAARAKRLIEG